MTDTRIHTRALCADLVRFKWQDASGWERTAAVLLEDISPRGACVQVEYAVPVNIDAEVSHGEWTASCRTVYCVYREIGFFVGIEFEQDAPWSKLDFQPSHLLDLGELFAG